MRRAWYGVVVVVVLLGLGVVAAVASRAPAAVDTSDPLTGQEVVGTLRLDGVGNGDAIELRGFELAGSGAAVSGRGESTPGVFAPVVALKDVDAMTPSLMRAALTGQAIRSATFSIEPSSQSGQGAMTVKLENVTLAQSSVTHEGKAGQRLLERLEFGLSTANVTIESGGSTFCWQVLANRTC